MQIKQSLLGITLVVSCLTLFIVAINRGLLALLLISSFFLALSLLMVILQLINWLLIISTRSKIFFLAPALATVDSPFSISFSKLKTLLPFINYSLNFTFTFDKRFYHFKHNLTTKDNQTGFTLSKRGYYKVTISLGSSDYFGFFTTKNKLNYLYLNLVIPPVSFNDFSLKSSEHNDIGLKKAFKAADERLESRNYYPGDDTRLINWKLFGRFNQLFIRHNENTSPINSEVIICLFIPPATHNEQANDELDHLLKTCLLLSRHFKQTHRPVNLYLGNNYLTNFEADNQTERAKLSFCRPGEPYSINLSDYNKDKTLIFVGLAGDRFFIEAINKQNTKKPLIITSHEAGFTQSCQNLLFVARTLGLEGYYV
ncbi:MAG: DUF58 domain-containing protein [Spirochaetaceae bacterium]|nr:DUF58 domain-containing protein [Spirochaetaceae bacterium]